VLLLEETNSFLHQLPLIQSKTKDSFKQLQMFLQILEIKCEEKENPKEIQDLNHFITKHRKVTKE
jgi:hypothetical protein